MNLSVVYSRVQHYLHNILWIMGDKVATLVIGFFVTVIVARYLGPEDFGLYSYAISTTAIFASAGHMGLSGLVVREIVKKPELRGETLGTTLGLKFIGMSAGYVLLLLYAAWYEGLHSIEFILIVMSGAVLLCNPFQVLEFWFQAFLQAKYVTYARLASVLISSAIKIACILLSASVVYFVGANLIQSIVACIASIVIYKMTSTLRLSDWKFNWTRAKELFSQGWVIYLGSIFAVINVKLDQMMLRWMGGAESVGVYSVAAQLSETWYFLPTAIVTTLFPKLITLHDRNQSEFNRRFQQLLDLLFGLAFLVALAMVFISDVAILFFYGEHFRDSADVLIIHVWAGLFIFMRAAFSKWILIQDALVFSLLTQAIGALVNVVLNIYLIPNYGVIGAAYATLISYAFSSYFSLALYSKTRPVFIMMTKSFIFPLRYVSRHLIR